MKIPESWTFKSDEVAKGFNAHVREQLPWYDVVSDSLVSIVRHYLPQDGLVYDIGAANGNIGRRLEATLSERNAALVGVESSPAFKPYYTAPGLMVVENAVSFSYEDFDVAICFLILMFLTVDERETLLNRLQSQVSRGGAIIIVERFVPEAGYPGLVTSRLSIAGKIAAGVDPKDIVEKELSLAGMQRPLSVEELPMGSYEWFRMGDFRGYVVEG